MDASVSLITSPESRKEDENDLQKNSFVTTNSTLNSSVNHDHNNLTNHSSDVESNEVFTQTKVIIDSVIFNTLSVNPDIFLLKLKEECGVVVEKSTKTIGHYVLRGHWNQMTKAHQKLKHSLAALRQPLSDVAENQVNANDSARTYTDKAVTCDIIRGELTTTPNEHTRRARVVSVIVQRSRSPSQRIKEKYRAKRRNSKPKKMLNPCLKISNKLVPISQAAAKNTCTENEVDSISYDLTENDQSDVDRLDMENVEPTPVVTKHKFTKNTKAKPKKNYEELTPFKFFCKLCSFKTKRESHYQKHLAIHKKVTTLYNCDQCSFTSIRLSHMRRHEMSHSQTTYPCSQCAYKTDDMKLLVRHMKIKHERDEDEQPKDLLQCTECPYQTTKHYHYQRHLRVHSGTSRGTTQLFQCDQCVYKTSRKEHFSRHVNNVHSNKRPYLCDFCGKAFKRTDALKQHRVTHATIDPLEIQFRCNVCSKNCRSHAHLLEHQAVHSNVRSFLCEICGASFKTRSVQRKHVLTIHKKPRAYSCEFCDKRFNTNYALRRHVRLHEIGNDVTHTTTSNVTDSTPLVTTSSADAEQMTTTVSHQSVILLPTSEGQLHATSSDLTTGIPYTIQPAIQLASGSVLQSTESTNSGTEMTTLVPLQEAINIDDGRATSQAFINTNEATTALLYLTTNFVPY